MVAINGGAASAPQLLQARDPAQRRTLDNAAPGSQPAAAFGAGIAAVDGREPAARPDRTQLAMIPDRFWPYDVWLHERGWTDDPTPSGDEGTDNGIAAAAASGLRAYRETAQRSARVEALVPPEDARAAGDADADATDPLRSAVGHGPDETSAEDPDRERDEPWQAPTSGDGGGPPGRDAGRLAADAPESTAGEGPAGATLRKPIRS